MALYEYKAVTPSGETLTGEMEATSSDLVIRRLQEAGNIPVMAREAGSGYRLDTLFRRRRGLNQKEIGEVTQQMATLLGAGMPLDRSLGIMVDLAENERVERVMGEVRNRVREGGSLSESLEEQHGVFSRFYINMVRAGEIGGSLDETLSRLAEYLERTKEVRDSVVSALIYPAFLMVLALASLIVLMGYVVPQFTPMFEDLGQDLPLLTQIVMGVGSIIQGYWWLLLLLAAAVVIWSRRQMARPATRLKWDDRFLRIKGVGGLIARTETAKLARTTGTLLVNGVPLLTALSIAKNVLNNSVLQEDVAEAAKKVKTGTPLARALAASGRFPRLALQMINVGEESGQLDVMLVRVAGTYDREVKTTIDRLLALMVPVLILFLALLIAVIVISVLLPMLQANQLAY